MARLRLRHFLFLEVERMKKAITILLALVMVLSLGISASAATVQVSPQKLSVNGTEVACEKYNIDGNNYFKLRDIAQLMNGTAGQFSVGWDAAANTVSIVTGESYTPNGTELVTGQDNSATAVPSAQTIVINGQVRSDIAAYNIGGSNFFKLRDLGSALNLFVDYDAATNTAILNSTAPAGTGGNNGSTQVPAINNANNLVGVWSGKHKYGGSLGETWLRSDGTYTQVSDDHGIQAFYFGTYTVSGSSIKFHRDLYIFYMDSKGTIYDEKKDFEYAIDDYFQGLSKINSHPMHDSVYPILAKYVNYAAIPSLTDAMKYQIEAYNAIITGKMNDRLERGFYDAYKNIRNAKESIIEARKYFIMHPEWQSKIDQICEYYDKMLALPATSDSILTWSDYDGFIINLQSELTDEMTKET